MFDGKKVIALIQARCTSTRLPMKHFRYIGERMLINWVVDRLKNINEIDEIIISTTNEEANEPFKEYCNKKRIGFYEYDGDINDVVGRHYNAVKDKKTDYIVVISGDCPLVDEKVIRKQLELLNKDYDYCRPIKSCIHEGIDSYSIQCLEFINNNSRTSYERENFGIIIRENLGLVKVGYFDLEDKYTKNNFRISVDNMADLRFMNGIFNELNREDKKFHIDNVIDLINEKEELLDINSHVQQKTKGEKTYRFLMKTEASQEKGLGHLRRMINLGQFLNEDKNNGVLYAINDNKLAKDFLKLNGYNYDYRIVEDELNLIEFINQYKIDVLIIDVQKLKGKTKYNFNNIKEQTSIKKIVLIDRYEYIGKVDLIILQGIQRDEILNKIDRKKTIYGTKCIFISNQFKKVIMKPKNVIVVSFGGTDKSNSTTEIVRILKNIKINTNYKYKLILGPYYKFEQELKNELKDFKYQYEIIKNPENMAEQIKDAKLGIVYHGVTSYEFAYLGIPTLSIVTDKIYEKEFYKLEEMGISNYCGTIPEIQANKIEYFINNIDICKKYKGDICNMNYIYENIMNDL
jgi:spore coat polysaccharide biosynthesis protein SpsF (cytidylyltransferase family)